MSHKELSIDFNQKQSKFLQELAREQKISVEDLFERALMLELVMASEFQKGNRIFIATSDGTKIRKFNNPKKLSWNSN